MIDPHFSDGMKGEAADNYRSHDLHFVRLLLC